MSSLFVFSLGIICSVLYPLCGSYRTTSIDKYKMAWQLKMAEVHKINTYIIDEQRYLNLELSLSEIAEKFNITSGYLSQLINTHSEQNFNDYINGLHIEASKKMLVEGHFENYTLE